jgi:hypothetical protein
MAVERHADFFALPNALEHPINHLLVGHGTVFPFAPETVFGDGIQLGDPHVARIEQAIRTFDDGERFER